MNKNELILVFSAEGFFEVLGLQEEFFFFSLKFELNQLFFIFCVPLSVFQGRETAKYEKDFKD
jgi:hypothetical protein